ncbi:MAG: hypothetical protein PHW12_05025 [Smithella sp.]|nr:hypothetical protein [Smithella sp.]MDD5672567.1 hypothetical protein [Chitinivibrionales bacterium]
MDDNLSKAAAIREKFKQRSVTPGPEKKDTEEAQVGSILAKAHEREALYSEVGQERAVEHKKDRAKHDHAKTQYRQTTLRILLRDLARLKNLESRFLSESEVLTYEKVFVAGLETIEKMNDSELKGYIAKSNKE